MLEGEGSLEIWLARRLLELQRRSPREIPSVRHWRDRRRHARRSRWGDRETYLGFNFGGDFVDAGRSLASPKLRDGELLLAEIHSHHPEHPEWNSRIDVYLRLVVGQYEVVGVERESHARPVPTTSLRRR